MCEIRWGVGDIWLAIQGCDLFLRKAADLADRLLRVQFFTNHDRHSLGDVWPVLHAEGVGSSQGLARRGCLGWRHIGGSPLERTFQHPGAGPDGADDLGGRFCKILVCA